MLEEPILYSLWGLRKFFLGITPSSLNGFGWNLEYNCGSRVHTRIKIVRGNCPEGSSKQHQNTFCFFVSSIQHGLSDTYPVLISTVFETTGMNLCARAYTCDKFPNFCIGVLQDPKNCPQKHYFGWGACYQHTPEIAHFGQSVSFRGLVDILRVCLFYVSFDGRCTVWVLWPPEDVHFIDIVNTTSFLVTSGSIKIWCRK